MFDKSNWEEMSDYQLKALEDYILDVLESYENDIKDTEEKNLVMRIKLYELQLYILSRMS